MIQTSTCVKRRMAWDLVEEEGWFVWSISLHYTTYRGCVTGAGFTQNGRAEGLREGHQVHYLLLQPAVVP